PWNLDRIELVSDCVCSHTHVISNSQGGGLINLVGKADYNNALRHMLIVVQDRHGNDRHAVNVIATIHTVALPLYLFHLFFPDFKFGRIFPSQRSEAPLDFVPGMVAKCSNASSRCADKGWKAAAYVHVQPYK